MTLPTEFSALTVKALLPSFSGLPLMTSPLRLSPAGSEPSVMLQVMGAVPVAFNVKV